MFFEYFTVNLFRYRHFVVLLVYSQTPDDHLEWCGLVESKIRLLIGNLERNQHIALAHVNPRCFEYTKGNSPSKNNSNYSKSKTMNNGTNNSNNKELQSQQSSTEKVPLLQFNECDFNPPRLCAMWFIGLEFERTENLNVDLTDSIQSFTEHVIQHGVSIIV